MQMKLIEKSPATIEDAINYYKHLKNVNKYRHLLETISFQSKSSFSSKQYYSKHNLYNCFYVKNEQLQF